MTAIGQADNTVTFSFDKPKHAPIDEAATLAAIEAEAGQSFSDTPPAGTTPEATARPATSATPATAVVDDPSAQTAAPATATATPAVEASPEDLKTHEIEVDGQKFTVTEADLKAGHMRHRDYTQKTQKLADERRQIEADRKAWETKEATYQQELNALDAFLRNQQAIDAYRAKAFGAVQSTAAQPPAVDPNTPPTAAQVAEIARYNAEQVRLHTQTQLDQLKAQQEESLQRLNAAQQASQRARVEDEVTRHIGTILDKYPILKRFDGIEEDLMSDAARYTPKGSSLDDAKVRLVEAAERRIATIQAIANEAKKEAAVAAAKLKQTGSEPPGGAAPRPASGKKVTLHTKDRQTLIDQGIADMQAFMAQNT